MVALMSCHSGYLLAMPYVEAQGSRMALLVALALLKSAPCFGDVEFESVGVFVKAYSSRTGENRGHETLFCQQVGFGGHVPF